HKDADKKNVAIHHYNEETEKWELVGGEVEKEQLRVAVEHFSMYGVFAMDFAGGSGTAADPYLIETAEQLDKVRDYRTSHFKLMADIDLGVAPYNQGEGWEPIGMNGQPFGGTFDGDNKTISNLKINRPNENDIGL